MSKLPAFKPVLLFRRLECAGCEKLPTPREEASRRRALARTALPVHAQMPGFGTLDRGAQIIELWWACAPCRRRFAALRALLGERAQDLASPIWTVTMKKVNRRWGGTLRRSGLRIVGRRSEFGPVVDPAVHFMA